jgi:hypothetical protein
VYIFSLRCAIVCGFPQTAKVTKLLALQEESGEKMVRSAVTASEASKSAAQNG